MEPKYVSFWILTGNHVVTPNIFTFICQKWKKWLKEKKEKKKEEEEEKTFSIVILPAAAASFFAACCSLFLRDLISFFLQVAACCSVFFKGLISFRESAKVPVVHGRNIVPLFFFAACSSFFFIDFWILLGNLLKYRATW